MLKFNLALFLSTAAMLFFILRYRIHVHIEYTPRHSRRRGPQSGSTANRLPSADRGRHKAECPWCAAVGFDDYASFCYSGSSSAGISRPPRVAGKLPGEECTPVTRDLISALVNLGATKKEAQDRAAAAIAEGPGDFDALILRAMQYKAGRR
jgi:hypothetical protein